MTSISHVIQILQKQEVGLAEPELLMLRITQVLRRKRRLREFISLCQAIEDRLDPQSKWHELTVSSICEKFGVPRSTFYRKAKNLKEHGVLGIVPKRRGPKGPRLDNEIQSRIVELRDLEVSAKTISTIISVENQQKLPRSTTQYFLKQIGKSRLKRKKKKKQQIYKRFERSKPNELWQIDNVGPFYKPGKLFAFNVVDDHSRFCLAVKISDNQTTQSWIELLERLVQQYGVPEAILHDNGSQYIFNPTGALTKEFKAFLDKYGIRSVRSRIRHPETCGKVEKMQQSMQHEIRDLVHTDDIHQLQFAVDAWRDFYNTAREHSTTKMIPHQRYWGVSPSHQDMLSACQFYEQTLINFSRS
jgi:transposase InsO family protein